MICFPPFVVASSVTRCFAMSAGLGVHEEVGEREGAAQSCNDSGLSSNVDERSAQDAEQQDEDAVLSLARKFTAQSHQSHHGSPFQASEGSSLDPNSPTFNARSWAKAFYNVRYSSDVPARVAGVAFKNLNVSGIGSPTDFQSSVANAVLKLPAIFGRGAQKIDILRGLDGLVLPGEQCCVLGPPGSGCSTLLKSISGETHGFKVSPDSQLNYQGIAPVEMHKQFRGEAIYTAEVDRHYPQLTVGDTLYFAA
ncbi:Multidrug resistance protein [Paraconiothyrium brasiliense]|uniref:Multidrug resistance protein n=1 Tax=Paraconiothyrium brasiliense TaxID=300254 RepID=A0ABR3S7U1_9PLEO